MIRRAVLSCLVVALAMSCRTVNAGSNSKTYNLRGDVKRGLRFRTDTTLDAPKLTVRMLIEGLPPIEMPAAMRLDQVGQTEVTEESHGNPTRLRVTHEKDVTETRLKFPGEPESAETEKGSLTGRVELAEYRDGAWARTLEGTPPTEEQKRELRGDPEFDNSIYPTEMAVGSRWTVSGPALRRWLGLSNVLSTEGALELTLERVEKREDDEVAIISYTGMISATTLEEDNREAKITISDTGKILRSLKRAVDLEDTASGVLKLQFEKTIEQEDVVIPIKAEMAGPFTWATRSTIQ